jgi:hypothetical protein
MMLKWPVIALSAAMTLHANACDFDGKNSNIAILANNQGHGFALLERIYTRYDNMLETYDLSSCKKISSGVAKESKVMELLKGKGYYNILENNENERIEYNTSENLSFLFKLAYQNQKYTVSSQALPSGDIQQLNNIKEFLAGKSDAIQPDVVDKIQYKESLESVVYLFQAQNAIGKARPLSMQELKTWINNADSLKNALQNKWVWKNRFENILNPQYLNSLAPAASTINTLESIDEAIQTIQYLNQKQSSNNTSYASFYIEPLAKLVNQGIETVFQQIDPDQINFKDLYQKNQLWTSVSSLTKQGRFNITPQLIDLHFKTTLQKQNIENFKKNPEPFFIWK